MSILTVVGNACLELACVSGAAAAPGTAPGGAVEWLLESHPGVLELRLVHDERRTGDGGVLQIDSNRRVVTWEGIPGDRGCRQKLEVPFSGVRAVREEPDGTLRLQIRGQPRDRWVFVPLPHASWVAARASALTTGMSEDVQDTLVGPDGFSMPVGGLARFSGPQIRSDRVPGDVAADVRLGAERIRLALGRRPVPSVQLYEALNGRPAEVELKDLLANPAPLEGRAVRVRGILELLPHGRGLEILDQGAALAVVPQPELDPVVRSLVRDWRGKEVEVAGVLKRSGTAAEGMPSHEVVFWEYLGPEQAEARAEQARPATIRDLVERPAEFSGQTIRVVGRFRGANLQRDLDGPRPRSAWVIKSGRAAIWVVGHGPSGQGFALRPDLEQDTTKWVEVVGRLEGRGSVNVLRAVAVTLSAPATGTAGLRRLAPAVQPEVTFTLPLLGDEPVEPGARFLVQFSSYMDEDSFEGRVRLRYAGDAGALDELPQARWTYDDVRRTLIVEPGERLRPGATVELLLLPGIADAFATPLDTAGDGAGVRAARVLRWVVQQ